MDGNNIEKTVKMETGLDKSNSERSIVRELGMPVDDKPEKNIISHIFIKI